MFRGIVFDYAGVLTDPEADELFTALDVARDNGIRTALLSNAAGGSQARRRLAAWFDVLVFSGEAGVAKPEAEVYRLTADQLGLSVATCVFVDDSARNVEGAVAAGMVGIRHNSVRETLAELAVLFPVLEAR